MNRITRNGLGIIAAAAILALVGWLDGTVLVEARRIEGSTFELGPLLWWYFLAYLITAAGVFGVGLMGRWARSLAIGIIYLAGGAFFALLDIINWQLAASINGAPPVLPQPVANAIGQFYSWQQGPVGSTRIVGAAMFLVGLVVIVSVVRGRWLASPAEQATPDIRLGESARS